jgi:CxxC motif-containing protein
MKEFICISCPMGCHLSVDDTDKSNIIVTGNTCPRGKIYGINEVTRPKRMVTSSVKVTGGIDLVVSVKTKEAIDKNLIFDVLNELKNIEVKAPIKIGDVIIKNVLNSGVDVVASRNVGEKNEG